MQVKAVLFDIDGTLVNSNYFHVLAWQEAFASVGITFDRQVIHGQIGKGTDMLVPALIPGISKAEEKMLGDAHGKAFKSRYLNQVKAFPAARDLLMRVYAAGQQVVLASSASKGELEHYLDLLDVRDIVAQATGADDVESTKPAPDIFATALEKIAPLSAREVLVVGDTPYDVKAAIKCGIAAIALRSGKFSDDALREAGAIALYDDVAALLAGYDFSALAK
jgi:membrane protein